MESRKSIRSKGLGPLVGLGVGLAVTLGIALMPGTYGHVYGQTVPGNENGNGNDNNGNDNNGNNNDNGGGGGGGGGGTSSGGINIANTVGPGGAAVGTAGQLVTFSGIGNFGAVGGSTAGNAVFPGLCTITVTTPVDTVSTATMAGPNAYHILIQPGGPLGPGENVLASITCHVTPPVNNPLMVWYTTAGGTQVPIDPSMISMTANGDGSWEVKYSPANVQDFANGGATLYYQ